MKCNKNKVPMVRLGDYIEETDGRNTGNLLTLNELRGVSIEKKFIPTKADMDGVSLTSYKIVNYNEFCYVSVTSRNGGKISLALQQEEKPIIVSSSYVTFKTKEGLLPEYLYLLFCRSEFDRYARFNSWGSARETFDFSEMQRVQIPLPDIEVQKSVVAAYKGLKNLIETNEALIEPLQNACNAYVVDLKKKYPMKPLGLYIDEYDEKNTGNKIKAVRSVSVYKDFRLTNAKVNKDELSGYKIVPPNHIAYVQTTKNEKCFANALNDTEETYVVSAVDKVIKSKNDSLLDIGYLHILFRRKEFDRLAIFNSWGSAREVFVYFDLCNVQIPLPPIEIQKAIVAVYKGLAEAKRIASEAKEELKKICPALVQMAARSA